MDETVTVHVEVPVPVTAIVPVAVPVAFNVMLFVANVTPATPLAYVPGSAYVTVYVTGPPCVKVAEGAPTVTVGGVLSHVQLAVFDVTFPFAAASWIVFAAIEHENGPSVEGVSVKL
jgi:hypothetical protein